MAFMFYGCSSLIELDLSSFNTSSVTKMAGMFNNCQNLNTIYISDDWSTNNVTASTDMFSQYYDLVGGNGTVYDSAVVDYAYARVDTAIYNDAGELVGGEKGYLTLKS